MRVLLLGCGMQGRAALHDLARCPGVTHVSCADADPDAAQSAIDRFAGGKAVTATLDARDPVALVALLRDGFDVAIDLLPPRFVRDVATAAIEARVHLVNTCYGTALSDLDGAARAAGIAILPEMGLDPGIDLVMAAEAVRRFDKVTRLVSYGGGIPEPGADDNPLRYRISWTLQGVLDSYARPARLIEHGHSVDIAAGEIFDRRTMKKLSVEPCGELEAYPNGDAVAYAHDLGIAGSAAEVGRYTLRWPGHCRFWRTAAGLGLLSAQPMPALGGRSPREFLVAQLGPQLQYGPSQRDLVILRVEASGLGGDAKSLAFELVDYRDLETGLMAMNRTVGFPASIAAQMIAGGAIPRRGLLSPIRDVPWTPLVDALAARGIAIVESPA